MSAMGTSVGTPCSGTWPELDSLLVTAPSLMPSLALSQVWTQSDDPLPHPIEKGHVLQYVGSKLTILLGSCVFQLVLLLRAACS